jgi:hypothetical protein
MRTFDIDAHYGRKIILNGKEYKVLPVALRDQIDGGFAAEHARALIDVNSGDIKTRLDMMVEFVKHYIPGLTDEEISATDWDVFLGLIDYIKGSSPEEIISKKNALQRAAGDMAALTEKTAGKAETTD